jgi:GNAT superfamily N-acetyltransferase
MIEPLRIHRAAVADIPVIAAFNQAMAQETEGHQLAMEVLIDGVTGLLENPQYGFYLVVQSDTGVIACLLVTFEWSDWRNGLIWWIQSVYVLPLWRRRGIYRKLYETVKNLAKSKSKVRGCRLYVDKGNAAAQQTYHALGMRKASYCLFEEFF